MFLVSQIERNVPTITLWITPFRMRQLDWAAADLPVIDDYLASAAAGTLA